MSVVLHLVVDHELELESTEDRNQKDDLLMDCEPKYVDAFH
jgi:hypothetical protein